MNLPAANGQVSGLGRVPVVRQGGGDALALLAQIEQHLRALRTEYVPTPYQKAAGFSLTTTGTPATAFFEHDTGTVEVNRIVVQCIAGAFDIVIGPSVASSTIFTLAAGFPPFTIPWPNSPLHIFLVNRSGTAVATGGIIIASASA